jgi:hypothetical protein
MNATPQTAAPHNQPETPLEDRDRQGRFAKCNPGGPGNPFYRRQSQLKRVLLACVSEEDMQAVMQVLMGLAKSGDLAAIKLFLQYTVGKPSKEVDPDKEEMHEWQLQQQTPRLEQVLEVSANGIETPRANQVVRELVPLVGDCQLQTVGQQLAAPLEEPLPPPDRNGGKRPRASARCLTADVPRPDITEDNGAAPDLNELFATLARAVHSVENGPERATRNWFQRKSNVNQPSAPDPG